MTPLIHPDEAYAIVDNETGMVLDIKLSLFDAKAIEGLGMSVRPVKLLQIVESQCPFYKGVVKPLAVVGGDS